MEWELLKQVSSGNEEAFRELYDRTHKKVYFYLYRFLGSREAAEDILMETFTEVWKKAGSFKGDSKVTTWMIAIARNIALNERKKNKPYEDIENFPHLSNGSCPDPEPFDRRRLLMEAMSQLSRKHREILDLVFYHEMTYPEVSRVLDIPVNTVKTRVFYAKEELRQILDQRGVGKDDL